MPGAVFAVSPTADGMLEFVTEALRSRGKTLDKDAQRQLHGFFAGGAERLKSDQLVESFDLEQPLRQVVDSITEQTQGVNTITQLGIRSVIASLCPLFPFC